MSVNYIFVVGPFSSGTTAVTGMLMHLGAAYLEPLSTTNDPRTPSSLESVAFQEMTRQLVHESSLSLKVSSVQIIEKLEQFKSHIELHAASSADLLSQTIVLKRATTALFLEQIESIFRPRFVFVFRNLDDIEKTKQRRGWLDCHGRWGAEIIQAKMKSWLQIAGNDNILSLDYEFVQENPYVAALLLNEHLRLNASEIQINEAAQWVARHQEKYQNTLKSQE